MQHPILEKNVRPPLSLTRDKESLVASAIGSCREDKIIFIYVFESCIIKQSKTLSF